MRHLVRPVAHAALLTAAAALLATPLAAQHRTTSIELAPYAGYMIFDDVYKGPMGTSLGSANGLVLGAQLGIKLSRHIALVGHVGRASASLQAGVPILGGIDVGNSSVWLFDGALQAGGTLPGAGAIPVAPFVQLGAGGMRSDTQSGFLTANTTDFVVNAGAGLDLGLAPSLAVRFMVKDYIGRFGSEDGSVLGNDGRIGHNWALSAGVKLAF